MPSPYLRLGRKVSIYITWLLLHTPLTGNQVTIISIICGLIGACLLGINQVVPLVIGIMLLQLSFILDFCDGEVARYYNAAGSHSGAYLDYLYHFYVPILYMGGLAMGIFNVIPRIEILAIAVLACAGVSQLHFFCKEHIVISHLRRNPGTAGQAVVQNAMKDAPLTIINTNRNITQPSIFARFVKLIGDCILYPYSFNIITAVVLADIMLSSGKPVISANFRLAFLTVAAFLLFLQTIKKVRSNFAVLSLMDKAQ